MNGFVVLCEKMWELGCLVLELNGVVTLKYNYTKEIGLYPLYVLLCMYRVVVLRVVECGVV